jgi:hypothetical protein
VSRLLRWARPASELRLAQLLVWGPRPEREVAIRWDPCPFRADRRGWRPPEDGRLLFDGPVVRLVEEGPQGMLLQPASYFDYCATNLQPRPSGARLPDWSGSPLVNAIGVNGLVWTSDGCLLTQRRGPRVNVRPGQLCCGFSGTLEPADVERAGCLAEVDVLRELEEELGVGPAEVQERRLLGLTRELPRWGTPELFYSVHLGLRAAAVQERFPPSEEGGQLCVTQPGAPMERASLPLLTALALEMA